MSYAFELLGVFPVLQFFSQQQRLEQTPERSRAYLGSYDCTLDGFIHAMQLIHQKPLWNWDAVVSTMVDFWLNHDESIRHWRWELSKAGSDNLVVAKITNINALRNEFEVLFDT